MADTSIQWTDKTWNPVRGCSIVSPGCSACYAMKQAHRFSGPGKAYEGLTQMSRGGPVWTGEVRTVPELLDWPLRLRKPSSIFVNSMSDLFHEDVPDYFIESVFVTMALARRHTFQVLTKRARRMMEWVSEGGRFSNILDRLRGSELEYWSGEETQPLSWPLPNVHLGVSVEDRPTADARIPLLCNTPAAVRFISYEPALGRVDLCETFGMWWNQTMQCFEAYGSAFNRNPNNHAEQALDWVIVGGESGPRARPFNVQWARDIIRQCKAAGVPCFVKQLGARPYFENPSARINLPIRHCEHFADDETGAAWTKLRDRAGADPMEWPPDLRIREFPRAVA